MYIKMKEKKTTPAPQGANSTKKPALPGSAPMAKEDPSPPPASSPARESPGPQPAADEAPLPAGFIFRYDGATKPECFRYRVLGLPRRRLGAVSRIRRGAALFLYDYDARYLYGPYRADSDGGRDLEPVAFEGRLPAQVKFVIDGDFMPVRGKTVRYTIKENYPGKFLPELTLTQVEKLRALFRPITSLPVLEAPPLHYVDNSQAAPSAVFLPPSASDPNYGTTLPEHVTDPTCSSDPNYETTSGRAAAPHEVTATNPQLVMHYVYAPGSEGATGETKQSSAEGAASAVYSHAGAPAITQAAPLVYAVAAAPANL